MVRPFRTLIALARGVYKATLTGNLTITTEMAQMYSLDGGLSNRNLTFFSPPQDYTGAPYWFYNRGSTNNLVIKDAAASTIATLLPGQGALVAWNGPTDGWLVLSKSGAGAGGSDFGAPGLLTDQIGESTSSAGVSILQKLIAAAGIRVKNSQALSFGNSDSITMTEDGSGNVDVSNGAGSGLLKFQTDALRWVDPTDTTKRVALDISGNSTGTTRTWTVPNQDIALSQWIQKTTTTISNAATKTLHATPVEIVAAPGAGKAIVDLRVNVKYVYATAAFDSVGGSDDMEFRYTDASGAKLANDIETTGMLDQTSDQYRMSGPVLTSLTPVANAPVVVTIATGEVYAAAGGGSLVIQAFYRVVTL